MRRCFIPSIGIRPVFLFAEGFSPLFVLEISRFSQTNSSRPLFAMCLKRTPQPIESFQFRWHTSHFCN